MENLLKDVTTILQTSKEARRLTMPLLSPDFNVFQFLQRDEMGLSNIIAWFLNPQESHGQGAIFLEAFVAQHEIKLEFSTQAIVKTEHTLKTKRRIDIAIMENDKAVYIENKLNWAGDQEDQVKDYLHDLEAKNGKLIYLTVYGDEPSEFSLKLDERNPNLFLMSAEGVINWLKQSRVHCQSHRVLNFMREFEHYIQSTILGNTDMTSDKKIIDLISKKENLEAAMHIRHKVREFQLELLTRLSKQLAELFSQEQDVVIIPHFQSYEKKFSKLEINFNKASNYNFCFEFQENNYNDLLYGLRVNTENNQATTKKEHENFKLCSLFQDKYSNPKVNGWWPIFISPSINDGMIRIPNNWANDVNGWYKIQDGTLAQEIYDTAILFRDRVRKKYPKENYI